MADFTYEQTRRCDEFMEHATLFRVLEWLDETVSRNLYIDNESGVPYEATVKLVGARGHWAASNVYIFIEEPRELSYPELVEKIESAHPGCGERCVGINAQNWRDYCERLNSL